VLYGRYRLVQRFGAGGMASVWVARDERLGRAVALKLLSDVLADQQGYLRRFEREARVAARLNHPNLVPVFDFSAAQERPYLVMELVRGGSVAERIAAGELGGLDRDALACELLSALDHIHGAGIVHRDLKPANVLLDDGTRARLTDFGIAQPHDATWPTQTGQVVGTPRYMAPEGRRGEMATARSDLYSLGVLLRECGAEELPHLAGLVASLGAEDPQGRPESAKEVLAFLHGAVDHTGSAPHGTAPTARLATDPTTVQPATTSGRQRTIRVAPRALIAGVATLALAAAVVAVAGGGGGGSESPRGADGDRPPTQQGDSERGRDPAPSGPAAAPAEPAPAKPVESCANLEEQKKALDEERKAAEQAAGDDKEAKEQIQDRYEADKTALEQGDRELQGPVQGR
jgi:hypothetical protein